jgi:hypothetical protein
MEKKIKSEFVQAYINVLVEAFGENVYEFIKEVVEDGEDDSPKNLEELQKYARRDIRWNFQQSNEKVLTEEFCRDVSSSYIGMFGTEDYLINQPV